MVKNFSGGNRVKSQARKLVASVHSHALRLSTDPLEQYACVTKIYGNGRIAVTTVNHLELLCVIRGKMRGRSKRHNVIILGSIILVGLREWEGPDNFKNADVLEVYDAGDVNKLFSIPSTKISNLEKFSEIFNKQKDDLGFEFSNDNLHDDSTLFVPKFNPLSTFGHSYTTDDIDIIDI